MSKTTEKKDITTSVYVFLTFTIIILLITLVVSIDWVEQRAIRKQTSNTLFRITQGFDNSLWSQQKIHNIIHELLAKNPNIGEAWHNKNREELLLETSPIYQKLRQHYTITSLHFIDENGISFLRVHDTERINDKIDWDILAEVSPSGDIIYGIEFSPEGIPRFQSLKPWHFGETHLGYLAIGQELEVILANLSQLNNADLLVAIDKTNLDQEKWEHYIDISGRTGDWNSFPTFVLLDRTCKVLGKDFCSFIKQNRENSGIFPFLLVLKNQVYDGGSIPLYNARNRKLGMLFFFQEISESYNKLVKLLLLLMVPGFIIGSIFLLVLSRDMRAMEQEVARKQKEIARDTAILNRKTRSLKNSSTFLRKTTTDVVRSTYGFVSHMSHGIRTSMTAILGYTEILNASVKDPELILAVENIAENGNRLLEITNDILDLAMIEGGKLKLQPERISPFQLVDEVSKAIELRLNSDKLQVQIDYMGILPETIETDPRRLRQALVNLLMNSLGFTNTNEKTVKLMIQYECQDQQKPLLCFAVVDSEFGMTQRQLDSIFQPLINKDSPTGSKYGEIGLGIALCDKLAVLLGGSILVTSTPATGTIFRLSVPTGDIEGVRFLLKEDYGPEEKKEEKPKSSDTISDKNSEFSCCVLVADDDLSCRTLVKTALGALGIQVSCAENGAQALEMISLAQETDRACDIVLMDMQMPVMDGLTASAELRKRGFEGVIIAVTASAMDIDPGECFAAGCNDYLAKPFALKDLRQIVKNYAGGDKKP